MSYSESDGAIDGSDGNGKGNLKCSDLSRKINERNENGGGFDMEGLRQGGFTDRRGCGTVLVTIPPHKVGDGDAFAFQCHGRGQVE
jgi:hypothetical protein